jgi:cytochrome c553
MRRRQDLAVRWPAPLLAAVCGLATVVAAHGQAAGDAVAGRQKAQACAVCHGPLGLSSAPDAPNLAAQPAIYLAAQLRAYRSGARQHEVMSVMSKTLTDADIDNLSAWYASLQVEVKPPS